MAQIFISFTPPVPNPDNFKVSYRVRNSGQGYFTFDFTGNSAYIIDVMPDQQYEGFVQTICSNGALSEPVHFVTSISPEIS